MEPEKSIKKLREQFIAQQKADVVWQVLAKAKTVSEIGTEHSIRPNVYYRKQNVFF